MFASYPGLLTPEFVTCNFNTGEGLVKLVLCSDVPRHWVEMWRNGTFSYTTRGSLIHV